MPAAVTAAGMVITSPQATAVFVLGVPVSTVEQPPSSIGSAAYVAGAWPCDSIQLRLADLSSHSILQFHTAFEPPSDRQKVRGSIPHPAYFSYPNKRSTGFSERNVAPVDQRHHQMDWLQRLRPPVFVPPPIHHHFCRIEELVTRTTLPRLLPPRLPLSPIAAGAAGHS
jgi:hypothetical protein